MTHRPPLNRTTWFATVVSCAIVFGAQAQVQGDSAVARPPETPAFLDSTVVIQPPPPVRRDSVAADSLYSRIIPHIGTATLTEPQWAAERERWQWTDTRSVTQVMDRFAGLFLRPEGESGAFVGTAWMGGSSTSDGIALDAVPLADPLTGRVNLSLVPLESLEGVERLTSVDALMLGHRWNLVTRQFSTIRPLTAIRFTQEPNETILSDGYFTQNIARSTNFLFGFQRHTSAGRFQNGVLNAWSLRSRVRANLADWLNLVGTWSYENTTRGMNGGVDRSLSSSVFDEVSAVVNRPNGYSIYERTDLGLGVIGRFLGDSVSTTRISVSSRKSAREYRRFPEFTSVIAERLFARSTDVRSSFEQVLGLPFVVLQAHGELGSVHIKTSEVYVERRVPQDRLGVSLRGDFWDLVVPRLAWGTSTLKGESGQEFAASLEVDPGAGFQAKISFYRRPLFPTLQEYFWEDTTLLRPTSLRRGEDVLTSADLGWSWRNNLAFDVEYFRRQQTDVVLARPAVTPSGTAAIALMQYSPTWTGLSSRAMIRVWRLELTGDLTFITLSGGDTLTQLLPRWWGSAELAFQDRLFKEELGVRAGVRTRFAERSRGLTPDPSSEFEMVNTTVQLGRAATLDVYGTMEIGDAFVTLSWENVMDAPWLRTAVYPMPDRQFKLGVRWVFLD